MRLIKKINKSDIVISDDVIASVASTAAEEVEGFGSFCARTPDLFNKLLPSGLSSPGKPVKVISSDSDLIIGLYIKVKESADVLKTSQNIQSAVKTSVQNMTGKIVSKVNVYIQGIDFCEPNELNENS